jgi:hypothetical protein
MMIDLLAPLGPESAHVAYCLEQAAWHQTRALANMREAHAARPRPLAAAEQRTLSLQALEHLVLAQQLVRQAQQLSRSPVQAHVLAERLARLQAVAASLEQEASRAFHAGLLPVPAQARTLEPPPG